MGAVKEYAGCVCEKLANVIAQNGTVPSYSFHTEMPDNPYEDWVFMDDAIEWWYEELFLALIENGWDFYDIISDHIGGHDVDGIEWTTLDRAVSHIAGFTERDDEVMGKFDKWIGWEAA